MRTSKKVLKRAICLFLIAILNINTFGAIVSDNDGSAFITKAEFDALKSSFQAQIDEYNSSIDAKIDGAIAAYLAGISLSVGSDVDLFCEVINANKKVVSVEKGTLSKDEKYENGGSISLARFNGLNSGGSSWPIYNTTNWVYAGGTLTNDGIGEAFVLSQNYEKVVQGYYKTAYINIFGGLNMGQLFQSNLAQYWFDFSSFDKVLLNDNYENIELDSGYIVGGAVNLNSKFSQTTFSFGTKDTAYNFNGDVSLYSTDSYGRFSLLPSTLVFTNSTSDADDTIYLFNECDEDVFIYRENDNEVELYTQPGYTMEIKQNFYSFNIKPYVYGESGYGPTSNHKSIWICITIPFVRMKQTHNKDSSTVYTNLNQLENGKLEYDNNFPSFYGGLPLFTLDKNSKELTFNLQIDPTVSSNKIRVWIKEGQFPNTMDFNASEWTTEISEGVTELSKLVTITTKENEDNDKNYIDINASELTELKIEGLEEDKYYFMKYSEILSDGTLRGYGGQIIELSSCYTIVEQ